MSMKFSDFDVDQSKCDDGVEVPLGSGTTIRVGRWQGPKHQEAIQLRGAPYFAASGGSRLPKDVSEKVSIESMADAVLIGWDGFSDEDGKPLPYSREEAIRVLTRYPEFRNEVVAAANNRSNFKAQATAVAAGN